MTFLSGLVRGLFRYKPSDLGYSDDLFVLPKLNINYHPVKNEKNMVINGQIMLFNNIARRLTEIREEQRCTIESRCERAVDLTNEHDILYIGVISMTRVIC